MYVPSWFVVFAGPDDAGDVDVGDMTGRAAGLCCCGREGAAGAGFDAGFAAVAAAGFCTIFGGAGAEGAAGAGAGAGAATGDR